jgi:ferredoxin-thioredoxin reductase catalytic subunit
MADEQLTDLPAEEEAKLREQYTQEMWDLANKFKKERGYELANADMTVSDFVSMRLKFGKFFCPCQPSNTDDTVCVCPPVENGMVDFEGACFCNFFVLPEGKKPIKDEIFDE